jgi:hypothetical protein
MKKTTASTALALAFILCLPVSLRAGDETKPHTQAKVSEDLGYDFQDGRTNKIARVLTVTPTHVQVIYEGGKGGRRIPRHQLPPELEAKYPCDASAAAEYQRQQAEIAAHQAAARQAAASEYLRKQEDSISAEIARLGKQDAKLQSDIQLYRRMPRGNGHKVQLANLLKQQQQVREQVRRLEAQLENLRARRSAFP